MKMSKYIIVAGALLLSVGLSLNSYAGNPDRAGSAGAGQLLVNPWARSSGLASTNMASIRGIEAQYLNVAGLAFLDKTQLMFTSTDYLGGAGIRVNALGFGQRVGEAGVLGLSIMNMNFGEIEITSVENPEGGIGSFNPTFTNIGLSYAKEFSNSIYGGITVRLLSESISNVTASGVSFDAGITYVTGENDHVRFGIAMKNVGPAMRFSGDGLSVTAVIPSTGTDLTVSQRSEKYELPSLVNIGFSYDFIFDENNKLTADAQFVSNSFTYDQFGLSARYSFKEKFIFRAGYMYENGITNKEDRRTVLTGPTAGVTLQIDAGESTKIGLDYSYRATNPFNGIHSIGLFLDI